MQRCPAPLLCSRGAGIIFEGDKRYETNPLAESMDDVVLIGEDGTRYTGEYVDMRIDRETIPMGKYAYDCRHDDDGDWVSPVTVENYVMVNFAGTFVTDAPIKFPNVKYPCISLKGWVYG